jgi:hypothetical protein
MTRTTVAPRITAGVETHLDVHARVKEEAAKNEEVGAQHIDDTSPDDAFLSRDRNRILLIGGTVVGLLLLARGIIGLA